MLTGNRKKAVFLVLLAALAGLFAAAALFSETSFQVGAFEITAALIPSLRGETVIVFPPFGRLRALTHYAPFLLEITLKNVDLGQLRASLQELSAAPAISFLQRELRDKAAHFLARQAIISFFCSALLLVVLRRGSRRRLLQGALAGGLLCLLLLALLLGTTLIYPYDISAFKNPRFEGALAAAPWIIRLAGEAQDTVGILSEQLEVMAVNLEDLSSRLREINPPPDSGEIRVLHVSDIHNNPAAFDLIEKVTGAFQINFIVDTGDLTDYGSEIETELAARLARLPLPYLFLPGNHDSLESIELLRSEGALIIGEERIEIEGLSIAGLPDPASEQPTAEVPSQDTLLQASLQAGERIFEGERPPDIFAVHNPLMAEPFFGKLPLILCGHTHSAGIYFDEDSPTILVNAGTTGASGVRGLLAPHQNPYSAAILYFNPGLDGGMELTAGDLISIEQLQDSFTLQRFFNRRSGS